MPLTDVRIRNAKPRARRYRLTDGNGLSLEISPSGGRYWRYRYRLGNKENLFAAGEWFPRPAGESAEDAAKRRAAGKLTLSEARIEREKWRALVASGSHPVLAKRAERLVAAASNANTFDALTTEFVDQRGAKWGDVHRRRFVALMKTDVSPDIGVLPIRAVTPAQVLATLRKIEDRGALTVATIARFSIGQVFRYAIATGKADTDPTLALRQALKTHTVKHHSPLEKADFPGFFAALGNAGAGRHTEIAVRLLAYLFPRTVELRAACWPEFDLDRAEWRIPSSRMKMRRPHVVPLPTQAVVLLRELHGITGHQHWLFTNVRRPKAPMAATTINRVIERMGFRDRFTAHGFRATASTMLHEAGFDSRLIELQLAHQDRNKSRASYDHSARLPERLKMMQWWADTVDALASSQSNAKVVPIGQRRA